MTKGENMRNKKCLIQPKPQLMSIFLWSQTISAWTTILLFIFCARWAENVWSRLPQMPFVGPTDWQLFIARKLQPNEIIGFQQSVKCVSQQFFGLDCSNYGRSGLNSSPSVGWQLVHAFGTNACQTGSLIASKWVQAFGNIFQSVWYSYKFHSWIAIPQNLIKHHRRCNFYKLHWGSSQI